MKAVRRHQLQDNALAKQLETFPEMLKRNASMIMLGITAVIAIVYFVRYRQGVAETRRQQLAESVATAREMPQQLRVLDSRVMLPEQLAEYRAKITQDANAAIETILREADDDTAVLRAEAWVYKGDLNWTLANLTPIAGATTRPMLGLPKSNDDYLKIAEDAYRDVINSYSKFPMSWVSAQNGIAAIAENRHDWATARQAYAAIMMNKDVAVLFQREAEAHLAQLPVIQNSLLIGNYPPTTNPTSGPTSGPASGPGDSSFSSPNGSGLDLNPAPGVSPATAPASRPSSMPAAK